VTLFPLKKKGFIDIRIVYNFILINILTIKPVYLIYNLKEALNTLVKLFFVIFFLANTINSYWAVLIKKGNEYKAAILALNRQWLFRRIGQGLKGAPYIYI
jgi:tryptophan-rich sensory protein